MASWNLTNHVWNNRIRLLGGGRCIGGRVPVGAFREMGRVGMVANPRAQRLFRKVVQLQVLLFFLGRTGNFTNFVRGNGPMDFIGRSCMFNCNFA